MSVTAKWGSIAFKVNSKSVFTFHDMKVSYSVRWEEHSLIGGEPKMEYKGPDLGELSISITLDGECGISPRKALKAFRTAARLGMVSYFYVGGKKVTGHKYYIASGTESWNEIWNKGELKRATAELTFKEYR